jgi:hypothetical protein
MSFAVPWGQYRFTLLSELRDRLPAEVQQFFLERQRQDWQHLINLYSNDTSTSGDIDYDYLCNNVIGFWRNLKSASHVQAASARFIDPPA